MKRQKRENITGRLDFKLFRESSWYRTEWESGRDSNPLASFWRPERSVLKTGGQNGLKWTEMVEIIGYLQVAHKPVFKLFSTS